MIPYLIVGFAAAVITFVTTPLVRLAVVRLGLLDKPGDRKVHARATPTLGGVAIFAGVAGAGLMARSMPDFAGVFTHSYEPLGIAAATVVIFVLGVIDDLKPLPAPVKLAGQIFASGVLFLSGVKMRFLVSFDGAISLSDDVSVLLTVAWLVVMINAVNLVDGLDGLAAGIVAIAASFFFIYIYRLAETGALGLGQLAPVVSSAPLVAIIVVGVSLGFLRYNFHPARIFMGDSGAMPLGLLLGAATVGGLGRSPVQTPEAFVAYLPLLLPLSVLAIPILDGVLAIFRRVRRRRSIWQADKEHLHHRLMDLGHGHRQTVVVMYVWSALVAGSALAFTFLDRSDLFYALPIAVAGLVIYTLFPVLTKAINQYFAR